MYMYQIKKVVSLIINVCKMLIMKTEEIQQTEESLQTVPGSMLVSY